MSDCTLSFPCSKTAYLLWTLKAPGLVKLDGMSSLRSEAFKTVSVLSCLHVGVGLNRNSGAHVMFSYSIKPALFSFSK